MKLINAFYAVLTVTVAAASWKYLEPLVKPNGTAVIHVSTDGKNGNQPMTLKLPSNLTKKQLELLNFAYDVAKADGFKHPQYLQGIIMQESKIGNMQEWRVAGLTNAVGDRYFGIGQIKLAAAKAVMNRYPQMWKYLDTRTDEELQARLILDDKFNIRVASKYVLMMGINDNPTFAITAYNAGPGGAKNVDPESHPYTLQVKQHSNNLKSILSANREIKS